MTATAQSSAAPRSIAGALTSKRGAKLTSYVALVVVWVVLAQGFERVAGPVEVAENLYQEFERGEVFSSFGVTLVRFVVGVGAATIIGMVVGGFTGLSRVWEAMLGDVILVGLAIPGVIWAFLSVMFFGLGSQAAIFATIVATAPFVAINVDKGVRAVSPGLISMSHAYGVPLGRRLRHLFLPGVLGYLAAGIRIAIIIGWNVVLLSEWFGANSGVGFRARYWYDANRYAGFAAWVVLFIVFIILLDRLLLDRALRRAFAWRPEKEPEEVTAPTA